MCGRYCVSLLVLHGLLSIHASYAHPIINEIMRLSLDRPTGAAVTRSQNFENRLASTKRINQSQASLLLLLELLDTMNTKVK